MGGFISGTLAHMTTNNPEFGNQILVTLIKLYNKYFLQLLWKENNNANLKRAIVNGYSIVCYSTVTILFILLW